jgi:hypothetical protein
LADEAEIGTGGKTMKIKYAIGEALYFIAGLAKAIGERASRIAHVAAILQADHMRVRRT